MMLRFLEEMKPLHCVYNYVYLVLVPPVSGTQSRMLCRLCFEYPCSTVYAAVRQLYTHNPLTDLRFARLWRPGTTMAAISSTKGGRFRARSF